jgi:hypothetical protein
VAGGEVMAPAEQLYELMSDISEECMCAGWIIDLEYTLWAMLKGERSKKYGQSTVTDDQIAELMRLRDECGGWWWHPPDPTHETPPELISTEEFERLYRERQQ